VTRADNAHHLRRAAAARHAAAVDRARAAIEGLDRTGQPVSFTAVARTATVSRSWLYSQTDLRAAILDLRREPALAIPAPPAAQRASLESLRQRLDGARQDITQLRTENAALHEQLARALGEQRIRR
jgi:hypothetical protein